MRTHARFAGSPASSPWILLALLTASAFWVTPGRADGFKRTIYVDMVALDQPFLWNRLGTSTPGGMIYALKGDVVPISGTD